MGEKGVYAGVMIGGDNKMGTSRNDGKEEIVRWIKERFPEGATCLDVGAGNGRWLDLLGDYLDMDAVEIFEPYVDRYFLREKYRNVFVGDIAGMEYDWYDLILFGDVIEHMDAMKAKKVLSYAYQRCKDLIIVVPFMYKQGEVDGNPWERHIQDHLTAVSFAELYPGFRMICRPAWDYAYYAKENVNN